MCVGRNTLIGCTGIKYRTYNLYDFNRLYIKGINNLYFYTNLLSQLDD